ncbi:MAG: hypothetical protein M3297_05835 [Thermoproteota archaeon]|nr:hypothetical protein [Thermoproteota archaeon]
MLKKKQLLGILGMVFAIAGGISWFFQAGIFAFIFWGAAIVIAFKLRRKGEV